LLTITCLIDEILTELAFPGPIMALCFTSAKLEIEGKSVPLRAILSNSLGGCLQLKKKGKNKRKNNPSHAAGLGKTIAPKHDTKAQRKKVLEKCKTHLMSPVKI